MPRLRKISKAVMSVICISFVLLSLNLSTVTASPQPAQSFILLNTYSRVMKTGEEFCLKAVTSNGKKPRFSSDNPKVAAIRPSGRITAKKAGSATITAKIKNREARCKITVKPPALQLNTRRLSLKNGERARLKVTAAGHRITYKSSSPGIASVNKKGVIQGKKPGIAVITATAGQTSAVCKVTVEKSK